MAGQSMKALPTSTIRLIASSQVITSVTSVVKELIENSLDANAISVDIKIENYGFDRIEIRDNGCGIQPSDTQFMAQPHFTSKITSTEDLQNLETYGFRGEALGSLCAVSDVTIVTKTDTDDIAMAYTMNQKGLITGSKPSHLGTGTTVSACNLFKNLPVRKQYLNSLRKRKDEMKKVEDWVMAFGVIRPDIRVSLRHNKDLIWQKNKVSDSKCVLQSIMGNNVMAHMQHIKEESMVSKISIDAYLPRCGSDSQLTSRSTADRCFMYINMRPVHIKDLEKLLKQYYCNSVQCDTGRWPVAFVSVLLPPDGVDVNLEPNKTSVLVHNKEDLVALFRALLENLYGSLENNNKKSSDSHGDECLNVDKAMSVTMVASHEKSTESERIPCTAHLENNLDEERATHLEYNLNEDRVGLNKEGETTDFVTSTSRNVDEGLTVPSKVSADEVKSTVRTSDRECRDPDKSALSTVAQETIASDSVEFMQIIQPSQRDKEDHVPLTQIDFDLFTDDDFTLEKLQNVPLSETSNHGNDEILHMNVTTDNSLVKKTDCNLGNRAEEINKANKDSGIGEMQSSNSPRGSALQNQACKKAVDWSSGSALKGSTCADDRIEPVKLLAPTPDQLTKRRHGTNSPILSKSSKKKLSSNLMNQSLIYEHISHVPPQEFCLKVKPQVLVEYPNGDDRQVTAILTDRWKSLPDNEKQLYQTASTSRSNPGNSKRSSLSPDDLGKILKKRKIQKTESISPPCKAAVKTLNVPFSVKHLKAKFAAGFRQSQSQCNIKVLIGSVKSHAVWLCLHGNKINIFNPIRAQEVLIYQKLLRVHKLTTNRLDVPIRLSKSTLGSALWEALMKMQKRDDQCSPYVYYTDDHIASNGFEIRQHKEVEDENACVEVISVCDAIPSYSVTDLHEILHIATSPHCTQLEHSRPNKVKHFLQSESVRMTRGLPNQYNREEVEDIMRQTSHKLPPECSTCFHGRSYYHCLYDLQDLPEDVDQVNDDSVSHL